MEIERKFVIRRLPDHITGGVIIKQGYLVSADDVELRIRRKGTKYYMTTKGSGDLSRLEWETEIPEWVFEALWEKTRGHQITKVRFSMTVGDLTHEFDKYLDNLDGLMVLEVEFASEEDARKFVLPGYGLGGFDVTDDKRFKNKNLARLNSDELKALLRSVGTSKKSKV